MPSINVLAPHQLTQDDALTRVRSFIEQAKMQFGDRVTITQEMWNGYVCMFSGSGAGFSVSGTISVNPSDVTVESSLPLAGILFKARIEGTIRNQLSQVLSSPTFS